MSKGKFKLTGIRSKEFPVMEISDEGVYVWFKRGAKAEKTIVKRRWPLLAVDIDKEGDVIGVELVPMPTSFTINSIINPAGFKVSDRVAAKTQIMPVEKMKSEAVPA